MPSILDMYAFFFCGALYLEKKRKSIVYERFYILADCHTISAKVLDFNMVKLPVAGKIIWG
jgi:hypothetical protein